MQTKVPARPTALTGRFPRKRYRFAPGRIQATTSCMTGSSLDQHLFSGKLRSHHRSFLARRVERTLDGNFAIRSRQQRLSRHRHVIGIITGQAVAKA